MISRIMIIVYQVNGQTINILSLPNISRADLGGELECRAQNNNYSAPANTNLEILVACESNYKENQCQGRGSQSQLTFCWF